MGEPPATQPSLLVRVRDTRDHQAWAQFVEIYAPLLYGFGRKHGLQDADAADLTQDVLQRVAGAIRRLDYDPRRGSFRGWLFTVARNHLRTFLGRQGRQCQGSGGTTAVELLHAQPAPAEDTEVWWEQEYQQRLFAWAAEQVRDEVEPTTWQAFWRTSVEKQPTREVARALGLTVAAVYMARSRVLARLRERVRQVQEQDLVPEEIRDG